MIPRHVQFLAVLLLAAGCSASSVARGGPDPTSEAKASGALSACRESAVQLRAEAVTASKDLKQHGIKMTPADVMAAVASSIPPGQTDFDCTGAFAAYLVLREQ